ncbi:unnamed protein product [Natator depressus]
MKTSCSSGFSTSDFGPLALTREFTTGQPQPARFAGSVSSPGLIITESLADCRNKYLASQRLMPRSQTPANSPALPPVSCPLECVRKTRKVCSLWKLDRRQQLIFPSSA